MAPSLSPRVAIRSVTSAGLPTIAGPLAHSHSWSASTVTDRARFKDIDETLAFSMTFPSGLVASCVSTYAAHVSRVDVATDTGRFGLEPALYYHGIKGFRTDGKPFAFPDVDQFAAEMDDFAICVRDGLPTRAFVVEVKRMVRFGRPKWIS